MALFICPNCGKIYKKSPDDVIAEGFACTCGKMVFMRNCYPILSAQDFVLSSVELFDAGKYIDKNNKNTIIEYLQKDNLKIDSSILDGYINIYENIKEKIH